MELAEGTYLTAPIELRSNITLRLAKGAMPESPITDLVLRNVRIDAHKGMTVGYATVAGEGVSIKVDEGDSISKLQGAKIALP